MDSFQQFRNKAKEKADRQKLLEQQEMKQRSHKEAVEKRHQEQKKREEMYVFVARSWAIHANVARCAAVGMRPTFTNPPLNITMSAIVVFFYRRQPLDQILGRDDLKSSPQGSGSPSPNDRAAAKRAELRRQEQERRRREAVSSQFAILLLLLFIRSTFCAPHNFCYLLTKLFQISHKNSGHTSRWPARST